MEDNQTMTSANPSLIDKPLGPDLLLPLLSGSLSRRHSLAQEVWERHWCGGTMIHVDRETLLAAGLLAVEAERVLAAVQLGLAAHLSQPPPPVIFTPQEAYEVVAPLLVAAERERFVVVVLGIKHQVRAVEMISEGAVDQCPVDLREVFRPAIRHRGSAVLVAHNHPSGDPHPSPQDLALTERLRKAGELLGIPLVDHLVVGSAGRFFSVEDLKAEVPQSQDLRAG